MVCAWRYPLRNLSFPGISIFIGVVYGLGSCSNSQGLGLIASCTNLQAADSVSAVESAGNHLEPAAGIDPLLWKALLAALEQSRATIERDPSKAPQGTQNVVNDLQVLSASTDSAVLGWTYRNTGDYDRNSQVNISDLTMIGLHFGKSDPSPDWSVAVQADGDGNGLITIADVTPIGANFGNVLSEYAVQRSTSGGSFTEAGVIAQSGGTSEQETGRLIFSLEVNGLKDGDALRVVARDKADGSLSQPSNEVVFTSALRPQNLQASQGELAGAISLSWDPLEEATAYRIERRHLSQSVFEFLAETSIGTSYLDEDVQPGQTRTYRVAAVIKEGLSAFSDSASGFSMPLPGKPLNPVASLGTVESAIEINWEAVSNATSYRIYRDGNATPIAEIPVTSYTDATDPLPNDHNYVVSAVNPAGEGEASIEVTGRSGIIPPAPTGLSASDAADTLVVSVSWTKADYADGYMIYRDEESNLIATLGDVDSYEDESLQDFNEHQYWVSAFTGLGESMKTGPESGSLKLLPPGVPVGVIASQGTQRDSVRVSWELDPAAEQYFVYRDGNPVEIATVGKVDHYDDNAVPDLSGHQYTVRAGNSAGTSLHSTPATGFADNRSDWWRFGLDNRANSRATVAGPAGSSLAWSYSTGSWIRCNPVMAADGTVYFGSYAGKFIALNPDGSEKWTYSAGADIYTAAAIAPDGSLYFGSHDFKLHAVDSAGNQKWTFSTSGIVRSSPAIGDDGRIYFGSNDKKLYCLDPDGNLVWSFTCGEEVRSSPAIAADGTIYFGSGKDNQLNALNADGTLKWKYNAGGWVRSSPAIAPDDTVYVGSSDGKLHAVSPAGVMKWTYSTADYIENCSPAIGADGRVYIGSGDDKLHCIDPVTGNAIWTYTTGGDIDSSPAIDSGGTIYVGSDDFKLHAVNPNGTGKWTYTTGALVDSAPLVGKDGRVYFGSSDGSLYCIGSN